MRVPRPNPTEAVFALEKWKPNELPMLGDIPNYDPYSRRAQENRQGPVRLPCVVFLCVLVGFAFWGVEVVVVEVCDVESFLLSCVGVCVCFVVGLVVVACVVAFGDEFLVGDGFGGVDVVGVFLGYGCN